jgi:hypothetical protein
MKILNSRFFEWDGPQAISRINDWLDGRPSTFDVIYEGNAMTMIVVHATDGEVQASDVGGGSDFVLVEDSAR